jgi:hypothetical protein
MSQEVRKQTYLKLNYWFLYSTFSELLFQILVSCILAPQHVIKFLTQTLSLTIFILQCGRDFNIF